MRMSTVKQRLAAEKLVGNGGNVTQAMIAAGYSPETANTPSKLTKAKGFQELCDDLGLTENLLIESLVSDIKAKKKNRKAELELGFKVRGKLSDNAVSNKTLVVVVTGQSATRYGVPNTVAGGNSA